MKPIYHFQLATQSQSQLPRSFVKNTLNSRMRDWLKPDPTQVISAAAALDLLLRGSSFLDVRAPVEFLRGTMKRAVNLPLLTDEERVRVGIHYRREGKEAAILLGEELLLPHREARENQWLGWASKEAEPILFCARGGLRSQIAQNWLKARGAQALRVAGGYKSLRAEVARILGQPRKYWVIGGYTGSGKTHFLRKMPSSEKLSAAIVDLEALANHRGSAFGKPIAQPQPSLQNFENDLALELLPTESDQAVLLEDESRMIGKLRVPHALYQFLAEAEFVFLDIPIEIRAENILRDYVKDIEKTHGGVVLREQLTQSTLSIRKKLGQERTDHLLALIEQALLTANDDLHRAWIRELLEHYYDPMYEYSMQRKGRRIRFRGDEAALQQFLEANAK